MKSASESTLNISVNSIVAIVLIVSNTYINVFLYNSLLVTQTHFFTNNLIMLPTKFNPPLLSGLISNVIF